MKGKLVLTFVTTPSLYDEIQKQTKNNCTISGDDTMMEIVHPYMNLLSIPDFLIESMARNLVSYYSMMDQDEDMIVYIGNELFITAIRLLIVKDIVSYKDVLFRFGFDTETEVDIQVNEYGRFGNMLPKEFIMVGSDLSIEIIKEARSKRDKHGD